MISKYIDFLLCPPVKLAIIFIVLGNLAAAIYGTVHLKVDFDPAWYVQQHDAILKIREYTEKYFPHVNEFKSKYDEPYFTTF